jgi:hypothetical protein
MTETPTVPLNGVTLMPAAAQELLHALQCAAGQRVLTSPGQYLAALSTLSAAMGLAPRAPRPGTAGAPLEGLTYAQLDFMRTVESDHVAIAQYLRTHARVRVVPNKEVPEAPPFALEVAANPGFWLGCFDTAEQAVAVATKVELTFTTALEDELLRKGYALPL